MDAAKTKNVSAAGYTKREGLQLVVDKWRINDKIRSRPKKRPS